MAQEPFATTLTTLERVKQHARVDSEVDDAEITQLIKETSARVQRYLGRHVLSRVWIHDGLQTHKPRLDSRGGVMLFLPEMPITNVATLKPYPTDTPLVEGYNKDFVVHAEEGIIELLGRTWLFGAKIVEITYTAGYMTAPSADQQSWTYGYDEASSDIRYATTVQAAAAYHSKQRLREGIASISSEGVSVQYLSGAWVPEVEDILAKYRTRMPSYV